MDPEEVQDMNEVRRSRRKERRRNVLCGWIHDTGLRRRYLVNFLVIMLGIGACVCLNGIGAEFPLLVKSAPEGSALPSNLAIAVVVAYIGPALYALFKRSANPLKIEHEFIWIFSVLVLATVVMGLVAFFHNVTITINAVDHSAVLIIFVSVLSSINALRNVLFLPYLRHIEEVNVSSFFIGEGLSGFIPSIVALIQGVGGDPVCPNNTTNSTDQPVPYALSPNFSSRDYFLFVTALLAASTGSFWLLEYLRVKTRPKKDDGEFRDYAEEHNSSRKLLDHGATEKTCEIGLMDVVDPTSTDAGVPSENHMSPVAQIYPCVLMWLACLVSHGYLNTIEVYSSRPYGNFAYHLAVNLSQLAGTAACGLAFWLPPISARSITGIMGVVLAATSYVTWLALCSPMPLWRDTAYGAGLVITIWIILISLISYAKLAVTEIVWRQTHDAGLYLLGFANLTGTICSATLIFYLVNFTALFTPYAACVMHG